MSLTLRPQRLLFDADSASPLDLTALPWTVIKMQLSPGAVSRTLVGASGGDGDRPLNDETTGNIVCKLWLRVDDEGSDAMDSELNIGQRLAGLLADAPRRAEGRIALDYRPPNSTKTNRLYVYAGQVDELPMEMSGESVGWYHGSPVYAVTMTCAPFIYGDQVTLSATASGTNRTIEVPNVPGDVDAEAELRIVGNGGDLVWGLECEGYNPGSPTPIGLTVGSGLTAGSISLVSVNATETPQTLVKIDPVALPSSRRVFASLYKGDPGLPFEYRLAWAVAGGAWNTNEWVATPPVAGTSTNKYQQLDLDLGVLAVDGPATVEGRVEIRRRPGGIAARPFLGTSLTFSGVSLYPCERFGRVRVPMMTLPSRRDLIALDNFERTDSPVALNGIAAKIGGNWATSGSAVDFTIGSNTFSVTRSGAADAVNPIAGSFSGEGRMALLPVVNVIAGSGASFQWDDNTHALSLLFRYVDALNFFRVGIRADTSGLRIYTEAGSVTLIRAFHWVDWSWAVLGTTRAEWCSVPHTFDVLFDGASFWAYVDGKLWATASADFPSATTAGGKTGFIDHRPALNSVSTYTEFRTWTWDGRSYVSDPIQTSDDSLQVIGGVRVPVPLSSGSRFFIPPAGPRGRTSRVVTTLASKDRLFGAGNVSYPNYTAQIVYRPRYRLPRGA